MRRILVAAMLALCIAVPAQAALPVDCANPCTLSAAATGILPPAAVIASGASVMWMPGDSVSHPISDVTVTNACFVAEVRPGNPQTVKFTISGSVLQAKQGTAAAKTCGSAVGNAAGAFVLPFRCTLHPNMAGVLVVHP